jgi:hypothetical protein
MSTQRPEPAGSPCSMKSARSAIFLTYSRQSVLTIWRCAFRRRPHGAAYREVAALGACLACVGLLIAPLARSAPPAQPPHQDFTCTFGTEKRVISVYNDDTANGGGKHGSCRVDYTKGGTTKTLWSSSSDRAYCAQKATSLVTKLAQGRFSCRAATLEQPDEAGPT